MGQPQNNYDPMVDFYKRAFDLLFKQAPVIILAVVGLYLLWQKLERLEVQRVADRLEVRRECAEAITEVRLDLSNCQHKNELLLTENKAITAEIAALKVTVGRWGRKITASYGVRE